MRFLKKIPNYSNVFTRSLWVSFSAYAGPNAFSDFITIVSTIPPPGDKYFIDTIALIYMKACAINTRAESSNKTRDFYDFTWLFSYLNGNASVISTVYFWIFYNFCQYVFIYQLFYNIILRSYSTFSV